MGIVKRAKNGRFYIVPSGGGPAKWLTSEEGERLWRAQKERAAKKATSKKATSKKAAEKKAPATTTTPRRRRARYITD